MTGPALACDGTCVGVVITDGSGLYLVRGPAAGYPARPVCAHRDGRASYAEAAAAEVRRQAGLEVPRMAMAAYAWLGDACPRGPGPGGAGHQWAVFTATLPAEPAPSAGAGTAPWWVPQAELQRLANRTARYTRGGMTAAEYAARPGLAPAWMHWLNQLGLIAVSRRDVRLACQLVPGSGS